MSEENGKNEYTTEKKLDERLSEQTQVILKTLDKRFSAMDASLDKKLNDAKNELK